jgi:phosphatidylglycerol:prolipoprotein diacylglycerol transferase
LATVITAAVIYPEYALSVLLALAAGALFPVMQDIRMPRHRRQYILLQLVMLVGAILGCKIAVLFGEFGFKWNGDGAAAVFWSGRSILGALIFGLLAAEIAKRVIGYPLPPNDRFAALLPFSLAIGRVGCLLHGCCLGTPHDGLCSITYADGIPRHPIAAYEIAFDVIIGVTFIFMVRRRISPGNLFSIFLILYGGFRFATEFVRETPKLYWGWLSGYQVLAFVTMMLGTAFIFARSRVAREDEVPAEPELQGAAHVL